MAMSKEVNEAIGSYDFTRALNLIETCAHNVEYYSANKIKLLSLLERCDEALTFFYNISDSHRSENVCEAMFTGLIINHRFIEAASLVLSTLNEKPGFKKLRNSFYNALIQLGLFDLAYKFTLTNEANIKEFNVGQLMNLATMLLIKKRKKQSAYIFSLITENFSINYWARITPWLMLELGREKEAFMALASLAEVDPARVLNTHFHFLKYEYSDLYHQLSSTQNDTDQMISSDDDNQVFMYLLEESKANIPFKYDFIKLCIWKHAHRLQKDSNSFVELLRANNHITALHDEAARSLYKMNTIKPLQEKHAPDAGNVANIINSVDGPVVLIASHLSYPGGLHTLYAKLDNLHYVKTPLGGDLKKEQVFNTIYIGPYFVKKPNIFELNKMLKVLKRNQSLLIKLDQQNQLIDSYPHNGNSELKREYNFYFSQLIWETQATCMFVDVDFYEGQYHFLLEKLPHPTDYHDQEAWQNDTIAEYDNHIFARIRGQRGKNNPALDDVTKSMLQHEYRQQFDRIDSMLSE